MAVPQMLAPKIDDLRKFYVGKDISKVPKPAVILDKAKMQRHCQSLLNAVDHLGVDFRAHVKTHKTREGLRLQVGVTNKDVKIVVSTIAEVEYLLPVLQEFENSGRHVNVLYGIPLPLFQVARLAKISRHLAPRSISVLVDNALQLDGLTKFREEAGFPAGIYLKVDTGYHRAGLPPSGINTNDLVARLMQLEDQGQAEFIGLYSHSSLSYNDSTPEQAMANLEGEIYGCLEALAVNANLFSKDKEIMISVGASPQVTSVENLLGSNEKLSENAQRLQQTIRKIMANETNGFRTKLELHAGVYSILDVQQLSTHSRAVFGDYEDEIAISVMAEVCSVYSNHEREQPEALAAVGVLGLGRESCLAYKGWGIIDHTAYSRLKPERRLMINRVSQEHSIVSWGQDDSGSKHQDTPIPLQVGQSIRIYPNHACVTGALYGWYLVVDSSNNSKSPTRIVDVWVRASGW